VATLSCSHNALDAVRHTAGIGWTMSPTSGGCPKSLAHRRPSCRVVVIARRSDGAVKRLALFSPVCSLMVGPLVLALSPHMHATSAVVAWILP